MPPPSFFLQKIIGAIKSVSGPTRLDVCPNPNLFTGKR
jgi:hypothetical protein